MEKKHLIGISGLILGITGAVLITNSVAAANVSVGINEVCGTDVGNCVEVQVSGSEGNISCPTGNAISKLSVYAGTHQKVSLLSSNGYTSSYSHNKATASVKVKTSNVDVSILSASCTSTQATPTPTPIANPSECVLTDLKGRFEYEGNHMSNNPVVGYFDNVSKNDNCEDDVTIHVFGSKHKNPEGDGWLESQEHVTSKTYTVPQGATNHKISFEVPNGDFCWYQVEATRTKEVKKPPYYNGNEMIDYVFVKDTDSCLEATPTPKVEATPTPTPKQEVLGTTKGGQPLYEAPKQVPQTPKTGAGALALASLLPTGLAGILLRRKSN